jgi:hypothetical protein
MLNRLSWDGSNFQKRKRSVDLYVSLHSWRMFRYALGFLAYVAGLMTIIAVAFERLLGRDIVGSAGLLALTATVSLLVWSFASGKRIGWNVAPLIKIEQTEAKIRALIAVHEPLITEENRKLIDLQTYRLFLQIVNSATAILSPELGSACAVTIKILWQDPASDSVFVHSFVRDSKSGPYRLQSPDLFELSSNTAFEEIMYNPQGNGYFVSDDLIGLAAKGKYKNTNERWPELYNSTAVVAIKGGDRIIGFLCLDSLDAKLSSARVRTLIGLLSSHAYTGFQLLLAGQHRLTLKSVNVSDVPLGFRLQKGAVLPYDREQQLLFQSVVARLEFVLKAVTEVDTDLMSASLKLSQEANLPNNLGRGTALRGLGRDAREISQIEEKSSMRDGEEQRPSHQLKVRTYREHLRELDDYISKSGRKLSPKEEEEVLRPPKIRLG